MGSAVKALSTAIDDKLRCAIWILFNLIVPEPKNGPSLAFEESRAACVVINRFGVLSAIQFDCQPGFAAGEVDYVRFDNKLSRESWPVVP